MTTKRVFVAQGFFLFLEVLRLSTHVVWRARKLGDQYIYKTCFVFSENLTI
jgi:hypothetical protein